MRRKKKGKQQRNHRQNRSQGGRLAWIGLILAILCGGVYLNTLGNGFVFDDQSLILQNPQVTEQRWGEIFGPRGYRPVRTFSYALNYAIGGTQPFGYHLFNVLLHAFNVMLLFHLVHEWLGSRLAAMLAALFFGLHPAQSAAVAYISGRKDLLATCFILAGLLLYTRFRRNRGKRWLALAMVSFVLAMLSKEVAIVFPALLLAAEVIWAEEERGWLQGWIRNVKAHPLVIAAAASLAALGIYYALYITGATRMTELWGGSWAANLGTSAKLFAHYLQLAVFPHPLIADYTGDVFPVSRGFSEPATLVAAALLIGYLALSVWSLGKKAAVGVGLLWFLIALSPVLQLIPFHEIAADHFLYLPLAGLSLSVGWLLAAAVSTPRYRTVSIAACTLVFSAFALRTFDRNRDWKDTRTLWESTLAAAPGSYRANLNLGRLEFESDRKSGLARTRKALELMPGDWMALGNLGGMLYTEGREALRKGDLGEVTRLTEEAIGLLRASTEAWPPGGPTWSNLGNCYRQLAEVAKRRGDLKRARELESAAESAYETALKNDPRRMVKATWYNLANLYADRSDYRAAIDALRTFLQYFPDHVGGNQSLGSHLIRVGDHAAAIPWLEKAVSRGAGPQAVQLLAAAYSRSGRSSDAVPLLENLARRTPSPEIQFELGLAYYQTGDYTKALGALEKVIASTAGAPLKQSARSLMESVRAAVSKPPSPES